jgi:hypothetical protein
MRFDVLLGDALIGWSALEFGDPPTGVAYGRFYPSDLYVPSVHAGPAIGLRVRPEGGDEFFEQAAGVHIEDLSDDFGPEGIEVSIIGMDSETYARFFPHHVADYEKQFRSR